MSNASGGGTTACDCNAGFIQSVNGDVCEFNCYSGCTACTGTNYYDCTACSANYYLLSGQCLDACPSGYTPDSTNKVCTQTLNNILSISLQNLIQLDTVSSLNVGFSNTNLYPSWESTDPVPSIYRGYYFTDSKYMDISSLKISFYYTISMWVKPISQGQFLLKSSLSTNIYKIDFLNTGFISVILKLKDGNTLSLAGSSSLFNS